MNWNDLTMAQKNELMQTYIRNGVTSLEDMRSHFNSFGDGGPKKTYKQWSNEMHVKYPWLELDSNKAGYDYERYFNENYNDAIARLNESEARHFTDKYKLPNHPTFSNESVYSQGPSIGGEWTKDDKFIPSVINQQQHSNVYDQDRAYTEKEIYDRLHKFDEGGSTGAVKKAMYNRMPIVGTYILPEVDITPEPERPNWFARQSMNAAIAENAPYMQAIGWEQDREGNYHQDPTTSGAEELRKALFEIGVNGAVDVFGAPLIEKALKYGVKGVQGLKNVHKSQKNLRAIDKTYERALEKITTNSDGTYTPEAFEQVKKLGEQKAKAMYGDNVDNVDITSLSYFKDEVPSKVVHKGRTVKTVRGGNKDVIRYENVESAINEMQQQLQEQPITTTDILKQAKKDFNRIRPGHTAALVDNLDLSKDSYPLLERLAQREAMHNTGKITPVIDDGNYRMIKLNRYGKYQGKKDIDRAIQGLRDVTGDVNIPNRVSLLGTHYVPAFTFTKFGNGGYLFATGGPTDPPNVLATNEDGLPYYVYPDIDIVSSALPQAKATDANIKRYADAVAKGQIKLTQIPNAELRNRVRAVPVMNQWYEDMNKAGTTAAAGLAGTMLAPYLISGATMTTPVVSAVMNNPIVDAGLTIQGAVTAPKNIKEGVQELQEGNYGRGALDLGLTALDLYGAGKLAKHGKNATKRLAEVFVRQGDKLHEITPDKAKELLRKKETLNYVFKGGKHPELAYKTGTYSGNDLSGNYTYPHEGDVVDAFFGKPRNKEEYVKELSIEDLSPEMQSYIEKNYRNKRRKIKVFDLGEVVDTGINDNDSWGLFKEIELPGQEEVKALGLRPDVEKRYVLDPGGYHHVKNILNENSNLLEHHNEDIWKFNPKDYKNRYKKSMKTRPHISHENMVDKAKNLGLRFIDAMGTPVVHTWHVNTPATFDAILNDFKVTKDIDTSHIDELIDFFNN